jgi:hypothetical protein
MAVENISIVPAITPTSYVVGGSHSPGIATVSAITPVSFTPGGGGGGGGMTTYYYRTNAWVYGSTTSLPVPAGATIYRITTT